MRRVAVAVGLDVVGSAAVLVLLALTWQTATVRRGAPFGDVIADLSGRSLQPAAFGLGLVTLAGAVAALATRGWGRRVVGVVVAGCGVVIAVVALRGLAAVDADRARSLVAGAIAARTTGGVTVPIEGGVVVVGTHPVWPVLVALAAVPIVLAGLLWVLRTPDSSRGLGGRYEAPRAAERPRDATLWSALDHGEDPTVSGTSGVDEDRTAGERDIDANPGPRTS